MSESCLRCDAPADVHVVGATDAHGVMFEEFWCSACYEDEEEKDE